MAGTPPNQDPPLTHLGERGEARMVEVGLKPETLRRAVAAGRVEMAAATLARIAAADLPKGEVLQVARLAAIQAVKRTAELIPLCHPLRITGVEVLLTPGAGPPGSPAYIDIEVTVSACDRTGVEMEALTAVSVAGLTIYDMCKAVDRSMRITAICLLEKRGGRSGLWQRDEDPA